MSVNVQRSPNLGTKLLVVKQKGRALANCWPQKPFFGETSCGPGPGATLLLRMEERVVAQRRLLVLVAETRPS